MALICIGSSFRNPNAILANAPDPIDGDFVFVGKLGQSPVIRLKPDCIDGALRDVPFLPAGVALSLGPPFAFWLWRLFDSKNL